MATTNNYVDIYKGKGGQVTKPGVANIMIDTMVMNPADERAGYLNKVATNETISGVITDAGNYRGESNGNSSIKFNVRRHSTLEGLTDAINSAAKPYLD